MCFTQIYTHTHSQTHTDTRQTDTSRDTQRQTHIQRQTQTHTYSHRHTLLLSLSLKHTHSLTHTNKSLLLLTGESKTPAQAPVARLLRFLNSISLTASTVPASTTWGEAVIQGGLEREEREKIYDERERSIGK